MAKLFVTLTVLCVLAAVLVVKGYDKESAIADFMDKMSECKDEVGATDSDFEELFNKTPPSTMEGKCFRSCIMKKYEMMNDNGKFDKEAALSHLQKVASEDEEMLETATEIIEKCSDIDVSDDHCEAAVQYGTCFKDEAMARNMQDKMAF